MLSARRSPSCLHSTNASALLGVRGLRRLPAGTEGLSSRLLPFLHHPPDPSVRVPAWENPQLPRARRGDPAASAGSSSVGGAQRVPGCAPIERPHSATGKHCLWILSPKAARQKQRCTAALSRFPGPLLCSSSHPALSQDGQVQSTPASRKGLCGLKARSATSEPQVPVCPFTAGKMGSLAVLAACSFHLVSASAPTCISIALWPSLPLQSLPAREHLSMAWRWQ